MGRFFGFKLRPVINEKGQFSADKGYISCKLFGQFYKRCLKLITRICGS